MKKTTKIIAFVLALIIAASAFSVSGFAIAEELTAGSSKEKAANIPEFGVDYVSSLDNAGEVDWFKFTTLSEDAYYHITMVNYSLSTGSNETWTPNIYLYDTYMQELGSAWHYSDGDAIINIKLETNRTYYIKVLMGRNATDSIGNYEINVSATYDSVPNEKENAVKVEVNSSNINSFNGTKDIDWFNFTAPTSGEYTVTLKKFSLPGGWNETWSPNIYLYDEYDQKLGSAFNNNENDATFTVTLEENETYYLKIYMGSNADTATGNYEFTVTCDGAKILTDISVKAMPSKTSYLVGESFDKTGLVINAEYSDGTSAPVTNYTLNGFDSTQAGNKTVTVSYTENGITKTVTFNVNVVSSSEDPEPGPGYQEENKGNFLESLLGIFAAIGEFFAWLINLIFGLIG